MIDYNYYCKKENDDALDWGNCNGTVCRSFLSFYETLGEIFIFIISRLIDEAKLYY